MQKPILYLRTVHWFGLSSGGSVAHTAGVINSFSKRSQLKVISNDKLTGVKVSVEKIPPISKKLPFIGEILYNFRIISQIRDTSFAKFIYQRYSGESFCGAFLARRSRVPFVLEFNSSDVWKLRNWSSDGGWIKRFVKRFIQYPVVKIIEHYNLSVADLIVVVSEPLKENLIGKGYDEKKILVNPNGVDLETLTPFAHGSGLKEQLGFKDEEFVVGFIGTFGPWHGVIEMAESILYFFQNAGRQARDSTRFLFIGSGKLLPKVKKIISSSPFADRVIFTGRISQESSPSYLAACDLFLSPHIPNPDGTKFFGSPTKLFEYMAMQRPIIASELDQIGEILTHNENAILVSPGKVESLAEAIEFLFERPKLRKRLVQNAYHLAKNEYTWDAHVDRILCRLVELQIVNE